MSVAKNTNTTLAEKFAGILCSEFKQSINQLTTGPTGAGKSYMNLSLAESISIELAAIRGGKPRDYFNIDHVAIMTSDELRRVMLNELKPHSCVMLDDIGTSLNARKYAAKQNIIFNDIFQTFRTENVFLSLSTPNSSLLDKVPRTLVGYLFEMQPPKFKQGYSVAKVFQMKPMSRFNKTYHLYLHDGSAKIFRVYFPKPSERLCKQYDRKREEQYKILAERALARWEEMEREESSQIPETKKSMAPEILDYVKSGKSVSSASKEFGISRAYVYTLLKDEGFSYE